jgi:hypothetical protein
MLINITKLLNTSGLGRIRVSAFRIHYSGDKLGVTPRFWSMIKKHFMKQKTEYLQE